MKVKIYFPIKSAMQSGKRSSKKWILAPIEEGKLRSINLLTGWTSVNSTVSQLKIYFATKDQAIEYAKKQGFEYEIREPEAAELKLKSYAGNFTKNL